MNAILLSLQLFLGKERNAFCKEELLAKLSFPTNFSPSLLLLLVLREKPKIVVSFSSSKGAPRPRRSPSRRTRFVGNISCAAPFFVRETSFSRALLATHVFREFMASEIRLKYIVSSREALEQGKSEEREEERRRGGVVNSHASSVP